MLSTDMQCNTAMMSLQVRLDVLQLVCQGLSSIDSSQDAAQVSCGAGRRSPKGLPEYPLHSAVACGPIVPWSVFFKRSTERSKGNVHYVLSV